MRDPPAQSLPELTIPRARFTPRNRRRILCVFPKYTHSFGTFHHAYRLMPGVRAFMPPQGLLVMAAYLPAEWEVRFVDENVKPAGDRDFAWADAVLTSGMHIQQPQIDRINERAHRAGKLTVLGGPSVSASPERYESFDAVHIGEIGDATDRLLEWIDAHEGRPPAQIRFETRERLPLSEFPIPAYHLIDLDQYFIASVQFSSGCPYRCEFCDIPELYGNEARLKSPDQVCRELDAMLASGNPGAVYFVDDNFIADRKAALRMLPRLVEWQRARGFPVQLACEATLNMAQYPDLLELMRQAYFCTVFCGIESPDPKALKGMVKPQNLAMPILEAVKTLNRHGMEVVSGIILGLDTDTPDTGENILEFIRVSQIPLLTINLLQALPKTPLWRRLESEGRLVADEGRESNVAYLMPYAQVVEMWRRCIGRAYDPEFLYERYAHQVAHTYPNRIEPPASKARVNASNIVKGLYLLASILVRIGLFGDYRRTFWKLAKPALRRGDIEIVIHVGLVAHHLIEFTRDCIRGEEAASFYAQGTRAEAKAPAPRGQRPGRKPRPVPSEPPIAVA